MAVKATLVVTFSSADANVRRQAMRELQNRVDGAVAPRLDTLVRDNGSGAAQVEFEDNVADEQILAVFKAAVNMAGLPESGYTAGTPALSGNVSSGSRQRVYSV